MPCSLRRTSKYQIESQEATSLPMNQRSFWCFILGFSNVQLPVLECNPYFIFFPFIGIFFSISVSCNLIGLFLCLTVGLIQQLQALKCSQQTTEKKNRQEIPWQYCQRTRSGKKNQCRRRKGLRSDNSQRQTWVQGTNRGIRHISRVRFHVETSEHIFFLVRGFDVTIPKDKLEFRGRTEVSGTYRRLYSLWVGKLNNYWSEPHI